MLTVIGCGNLNRCDDAVGVIIAQKLQEIFRDQNISNLQIYDCGTAGMEVMFQARGSEKLIIIDACSTDSEPGTIYRVPGEELEELPEASYSLHDFRWDHALAAGRKIFKDQFPNDVTVYLIEAENLGLGLEISPILKNSVKKVIKSIEKEINDFYLKDNSNK
ncbi:probable peptidase M52, hydrogen uptake protein [Crocosphaera subtropica ATCC 51142]|uniref:Probable peptidase M52, hydrogen uptake protein n=1 Tax=Crocosphaera subtropica (strain ATCC 51142 / BH68) TaxID=43989 RepID=B1WYS6_CROS5|nr:hydrogenase maturation protease [Crocosphaera subtropica]ACB51093.1 probable peptidase M52, hydrogen uptake protein [Crocosphaera subtropica ATCC 51142]